MGTEWFLFEWPILNLFNSKAVKRFVMIDSIQPARNWNGQFLSGVDPNFSFWWVKQQELTRKLQWHIFCCAYLGHQQHGVLTCRPTRISLSIHQSAESRNWNNVRRTESICKVSEGISDCNHSSVCRICLMEFQWFRCTCKSSQIAVRNSSLVCGVPVIVLWQTWKGEKSVLASAHKFQFFEVAFLVLLSFVVVPSVFWCPTPRAFWLCTALCGNHKR